MFWKLIQIIAGLSCLFLGGVCSYTSWVSIAEGMHHSLLPLWALGVCLAAGLLFAGSLLFYKAATAQID